MKKLLVLIVCVLWATLARADWHPQTTYPDGTETMWFENGRKPDAGYDGCVFIGMDSADDTVTSGDCSPAADTTLTIGRGAAASRQAALLKFDISALPDNAVIVEAKVYLFVASVSGAVAATADLFAFTPMAVDWDATACWYCKSDCGEAEELEWGSAGALDTSRVIPDFPVVAVPARSSESSTAAQWLVADTTTLVFPTIDGSPNYSISDSLYDGVDAVFDTWSPITGDDTSLRWKVIVPIKPGFVGNLVTKTVESWHRGTMANHGWRLGYQTRASTSITMRTNCAGFGCRPRLMVKYLYAEAGTGGGGRHSGSLGATP